MDKKTHSVLGTAFILASGAALAVPLATGAAPALVLAGLTASYLAADIGQWQFGKAFGKRHKPTTHKPG